MKEKFLLPVLAIISVLMLAACGSSGPEKTVDNFMKSYKDLNFEDIEKSVSTELEEEYTDAVDEQTEDFGIEDLTNAEGFKEFEASFKGLTKQVKYKITDTNVDGDNAEIKVDLTYADASEPILTSVTELFGQLMGLAFSGQEMTDEEATDKVVDILLSTVTDNLKDFKAETKDTNGVIKLAKEDKNWVITEFDENLMNGLLFGVVDGMEDFNPFSFDGEPVGEIEFNFDDIEVNEDIESTEVK